jgi:hypothetical protein
MTKTHLKKTSSPKAKGKGKGNGDKVIALLKRDRGASLTDITKATGWLPHSARAVLTGFRKKGFAIEKTKVDGITRWSITAGPAT